MQEDIDNSLLLEEINRLKQEITKLKVSLSDHKNREAALQRAKHERDAIPDQVRETILYVDPELKILYVNKIDSQMKGMLPVQMVGRYCYEFYHGRNEPCPNCNVRKVIETCQPQMAEVVYPDGILRLSRAYPIQDGDGNLLGVLEMGLDLTERKMAEEALKQSEEKYRSLVVNLNDVIYTVNAEGYITYISPVVERFSGYQAEEIIGTPFMSYIHPEDLQSLLESFRRSLSNQTEPAEFRLLRKDGTSIYVRSLSRALVENGQVSVAGVLSDITERKEAEEALRQSEERFFKAFHSSPCAMSITQLSDSRLIDVNQRWQDTTGFSREDAVGKTREDLNIWTKQQRQQARESLNEYGSVTNLETVFRNKKGEERDILWSGEIIMLNGEPCLLGAWIDITERKKYEKEIARLDRLNLMGEIAAGIAHEIRNPMTVVKGNLQILQLKEEFASHKKRFNTMIEELDRANAIITEFLSLARNAPPNLKKQSINSILTALVPLIQTDATKHGIAISLSLSDTPEINLDEKEIRQLVLNLVRNGIEAMPGHGELTIKTRKNKDRVVLSIKDRGKGIPPEVLEKIGTPFFTTKEKGTGLGLPVCFRIAESHNAKIEIKTGKRGTTFMVSFPILSPQDGVNDI